MATGQSFTSSTTPTPQGATGFTTRRREGTSIMGLLHSASSPSRRHRRRQPPPKRPLYLRPQARARAQARARVRRRLCRPRPSPLPRPRHQPRPRPRRFVSARAPSVHVTRAASQTHASAGAAVRSLPQPIRTASPAAAERTPEGATSAFRLQQTSAASATRMRYPSTSGSSPPPPRSTRAGRISSSSPRATAATSKARRSSAPVPAAGQEEEEEGGSRRAEAKTTHLLNRPQSTLTGPRTTWSALQTI
jgi:hypothetical protein